jgi:hypothetical protein
MSLMVRRAARITLSPAEAKDFDKFCRLLKEWGRFELVQDRGSADIGITLSTQLHYRTVRLPATGIGLGTVARQQVITSYIRIFNARDDVHSGPIKSILKAPKALSKDSKTR